MDFIKKHPRTYHHPLSPGKGADDKTAYNVDSDFHGLEVVVLEKMDGENTNIYRHAWHARSLDTPTTSWRERVARRQSAIGGFLEPRECIHCENVLARHSIAYDALQSDLYAFRVRMGDYMLSWDDTVERINELNAMVMDWEMPEFFIAIPKVLYRGPYSPDLVHKIQFNPNTTEGWVMSNAHSFPIGMYSCNVIKYVREGHVQTDEHWAHPEIVHNGIQYPSIPS